MVPLVNLTILPCRRVDVTKAGEWIEKDTGFLHNAGAPGSSGLMLNKSYDVTEIPVFIKAGTVLPSTPVRVGDTVGLAMRQYVELQFSIYPGTDSGEGVAYEDDAGTDAYLNGAFAETALTYTRSDTAFEATITTTGNYTELPKARRYTLMVSATMHMHAHKQTNAAAPPPLTPATAITLSTGTVSSMPAPYCGFYGVRGPYYLYSHLTPLPDVVTLNRS